LRAGELVHATLGSVEIDAHGDHWLHVLGKGSKAGKVVLPGMARAVLDRHLAQRGIPVTPAKWNPATPLLGRPELIAALRCRRSARIQGSPARALLPRRLRRWNPCFVISSQAARRLGQDRKSFDLSRDHHGTCSFSSGFLACRPETFLERALQGTARRCV
jgi:hypothetical protein